jgi:glycosyltransferase involved in cell wall biosynthesis
VKLIDLLAAGVPVVAENVGQVSEYIVDGQTGVLVPSGNAGALCEVVVALLQDPTKRQQLGAQAARWVRDRFSWDRLVDNVERAYGVPVSRA